MFRRSKDNLVGRCQFINGLLNSVNFLLPLCSYSNNDINEVINNISKIISYYLTTDNLIFTNFDELFSKINSNNNETSNMLYTSYNGYYQNYIKLYGINPSIPLKRLLYTNNTLEKIANSVSFIPSYMVNDSVPVFNTIEESLKYAFSSPSIIFENILKQPSGQEEPIIVGESEQDYYKKIIKERTRNMHSSNWNDTLSSVQCLLNNFIGQNIYIALIPSNKKELLIYKENTEDRLYSKIKPSSLNFINIPSRYSLIMMCAKNRQLIDGTKIDFKTGDIYIEKAQKDEIDSLTFYSRYETKCIDDEFNYVNIELTGDINYDIDLVYGALDTNNTKNIIPYRYQDNIESIKRKNDIIIREYDGKYLIRNGRHRLLYLKYIYNLYYRSYEKMGLLDKFKKSMSIPLYVEKTFNNEINNIIKKMKEKYKNTAVLKVDINNDDIELLIIINENVYYIKNTNEFIELSQELLTDNLDNKYLYDKSTYKKEIDYEQLKNYLISTLEEDIYTMNLLDLINYIKNNPIYINETLINNYVINYIQINFIYLYITHSIQLDNIFNQPHTIVEYAKEKHKKIK